MADGKKRMSSRRFMAIFIPITAVLLVSSIVITCVMEYWSTVMDAVFGEASISIQAADGTDTWNTDYYGLTAEGMTPEEKAAEGAELARRAEGEGIVLLKNQNNALPLTNNGQPLSQTNPITVNALGWSFYYPSTGGSGSGAVGSDGLVSPKEALAAAGIQINEALETYYLNWSNEHYTEWMVTKANGYYTDEDTNTSPARPSVSKAYQAAWDVPELNGQLVAEACDQSDAAANNVQIVWIGRGGGEYHDCPTVMTKEGGSVNTYGVNPDKHYLELTDEEEAVLAKAEELRGENGKVIVIINANNTMELGELQDDDRVDAILFVGGPGKQGFYAIGDVLNGTVNPSGRLADTYAADLLASPAMENFSSKVYYDADAAFPNQYDTMIDYTDADGSTSQRPILFVGYEEGIYVGYRFYETAAADGFFTSTQLPAGVTDPYYNRENGVIYPFGYGLSYTTFTQELTKASYSDGVFTFEVKVTNTGSVAGKDVVELYVETPYTPGGIEKSKVVLCGFDKTDILQPGADQTMTIRVEAEDLASYDDTVNQCYVLDAGDYTFYLGTVNGTVYGSHSWAYATPADSAGREPHKSRIPRMHPHPGDSVCLFHGVGRAGWRFLPFQFLLSGQQGVQIPAGGIGFSPFQKALQHQKLILGIVLGQAKIFQRPHLLFYPQVEFLLPPGDGLHLPPGLPALQLVGHHADAQHQEQNSKKSRGVPGNVHLIKQRHGFSLSGGCVSQAEKPGQWPRQFHPPPSGYSCPDTAG